MLPEHLRLTAQEELWAIPIGPDPQTKALGEPGAQSPRAALENAVLIGLQRPPCAISFSGGIDSSVVLALATHVARREGLPLPIPITNCFPKLEEADEAQWQQHVVSHLGLDEWTRLEWDDELDILGPIATDILERHGILAPFNSHFHYPLLKEVAGGSLLSGIGGDELFESVSRAVAAKVLIGHKRPGKGELRAVAFGLAPRALRARVKARRGSGRFDPYTWIRPEQRAALSRAHSDWESHDPLRTDRALREWWWRSRLVQCNIAGKNLLASDFDVLMHNPFLDADVLAACAKAGGAVGLGEGSRAQGFELLVGDLLPAEILRRRSKASFNGAFWNRHSQEFVANWDGAGLDPNAVDLDALLLEWAKIPPDPHSFAQLQRAWITARGVDIADTRLIT